MDTQRLAAYGIDYEKGLKNCMGSLPFYQKMLGMFLEDACLRDAQTAYDSGERQALFSRIHELKGVSGNLALTALYEASIPLVELLRAESGGEAELDRLFSAVKAAYASACEGIGLILRET